MSTDPAIIAKLLQREAARKARDAARYARNKGLLLEAKAAAVPVPTQKKCDVYLGLTNDEFNQVKRAMDAVRLRRSKVREARGSVSHVQDVDLRPQTFEEVVADHTNADHYTEWDSYKDREDSENEDWGGEDSDFLATLRGSLPLGVPCKVDHRGSVFTVTRWNK